MLNAVNQVDFTVGCSMGMASGPRSSPRAEELMCGKG